MRASASQIRAVYLLRSVALTRLNLSPVPITTYMVPLSPCLALAAIFVPKISQHLKDQWASTSILTESFRAARCDRCCLRWRWSASIGPICIRGKRCDLNRIHDIAAPTHPPTYPHPPKHIEISILRSEGNDSQCALLVSHDNEHLSFF